MQDPAARARLCAILSASMKPTLSDAQMLVRDLSVIAISILLAILLIRSHFTEQALEATQGQLLLVSFLAGLFFSSAFTAAPAMVVIGQLAQTNSLFEVAAVAAIGAVIGNLFIYRLFRGAVSDDLGRAFKRFGHADWLRFMRDRHFRWLSILIGSFAIITPLPDEFGIALLGLSKVPAPIFAGVCYVTNTMSMVFIGLVARHLV